jgi:hypothetical protein
MTTRSSTFEAYACVEEGRRRLREQRAFLSTSLPLKGAVAGRDSGHLSPCAAWEL